MVHPDGGMSYDGIKVFSATLAARRQRLGDDVTAWLQANPTLVPVDAVVRQSSDEAFHCFTIVLFWRAAGR
jgi:hypothetical protein